MESWEAFYRSDLAGVWALVVVPALFLLALRVLPRSASPGADPRAAAFVRAYAVVFGIETIVDAAGVGKLGFPMLPFVLLGDFRVFLLILAVAAPTRPLGGVVLEASAWTLVVPLTAWPAYRVLDRASGPLPESVLWLLYELAFLALALVWRGGLLPPRTPLALGYLRALLAYVALYYGLWAAADVVILSGYDAGWLLRVVPNLLYYGFWVPVAYALFFAPRFQPRLGR